MDTTAAAIFATSAVALYAGHHVGDYWIQTDKQAANKGAPGAIGQAYCLMHVISYLMTQTAVLFVAALVTGIPVGPVQAVIALAVSGVTHYAADRREHGLLFWLAPRLGHRDFIRFGQGERTVATGAWALDQSWHIFWGVFVAALVMAA